MLSPYLRSSLTLSRKSVVKFRDNLDDKIEADVDHPRCAIRQGMSGRVSVVLAWEWRLQEIGRFIDSERGEGNGRGKRR